ncbi:hypothetical protein N7536_000438 [Penicillium majusculum]|nr:hypothetical protein N7536_000438 [Penicillium majusculum]
MMNRSLMFRNAARPLSRYFVTQGSRTRHFHAITTNFITQDTTGNLVSRCYREPRTSLCVDLPNRRRATQDRCKLTFFHNAQHFGLASPSYPRLYVPAQFPRQSESNTSPATIFLSGKMYEIIIDGAEDGAVFTPA